MNLPGSSGWGVKWCQQRSAFDRVQLITSKIVKMNQRSSKLDTWLIVKSLLAVVVIVVAGLQASYSSFLLTEMRGVG